jgi:hypothetical protein
MNSIAIPPDVRAWLTGVFADCNHHVAAKMSQVPTVHETSLDLSFIEHLSYFVSPVQFPSKWLVRIDTHYLGGGRHWGEWEVADIGVLVIFRQGGHIVRTKVVLLQSKRLYPDEQELSEDEPIDYMIGFGRLMKGDESYLRITAPRTFSFSETSRYKAFRVGDRQFEAIRAYEKQYGIPVHYMLYHPLQLPYAQHVPVTPGPAHPQACEVGCRVISASDVNNTLGKFEKGYAPTFEDVRSIPSLATDGGKRPGWRLEAFIVDRVLDCHEGYIASDERDDGLSLVFNRRSGPISAAIAITFDAPG